MDRPIIENSIYETNLMEKGEIAYNHIRSRSDCINSRPVAGSTSYLDLVRKQRRVPVSRLHTLHSTDLTAGQLKGFAPLLV